MNSYRSTLLVLMIGLVSCRSTPGVPLDNPASGETVGAPVDLSVENHNWADVVISIEHEGQRSRLGTAKAAAATRMRIPAGWVGSAQVVRLVAHRVGSRSDFLSERFTVLGDQDVLWTLETDLQRSSLSLR